MVLPDDLLKKIGLINFQAEVIIPSLVEDNPDDSTRTFQISGAVGLIKGAIDSCFFDPKISEHSWFRISVAFCEALGNASDHGNHNNVNKQVVIKLWIGVGGVILSFQDEGDFFGQNSSKQALESGASLPSTRQPIPGGDGLDTIYEQLPEIFVSTAENALYLIFDNLEFLTE